MSNAYEEEVLLRQIKSLKSLIDKRVELQQELKIIRSKTPKSHKVIEEKIKEIRDLSQNILDLVLYIERQKPSDHILNRKKNKQTDYLPVQRLPFPFS